MSPSSEPVPIATPSPKWGLLSGLLSLSMVQGGVIPIPRGASSEAAAEMLSHSLGSSPKTVVGFAAQAFGGSVAHSAPGPGPAGALLSASPLRKSALSMAMGRGDTVKAQRPPTGRSPHSTTGNSGIPRQPSRLTSEIAAQQQQQLAQETHHHQQQRYLDFLMDPAPMSQDDSRASAGTQMSFGSSSVGRKDSVSQPSQQQRPPLEAASVPGGYYFESDGRRGGHGDDDGFSLMLEEEEEQGRRKHTHSERPPRHRQSLDRGRGGSATTEPWERRPWGEAYPSTPNSYKHAETFEIGSAPGTRVKMSPGL